MLGILVQSKHYFRHPCFEIVQSVLVSCELDSQGEFTGLPTHPSVVHQNELTVLTDGSIYICLYIA